MDHHLAVDPIINFALKRQVRGVYEREAHFSLISPDWVRQPTYFALSALASILDGRDASLDLSLQVAAEGVPAEEARLCHFSFVRSQTVETVTYANPQPGTYVPSGARKQDVSMVTVAFWRAVEAQADGAGLPVTLTMELADAEYGYPILLDPMTMPTRPFRALEYSQQGTVLTCRVTARDSPQFVRFFKTADEL